MTAILTWTRSSNHAFELCTFYLQGLTVLRVFFSIAVFVSTSLIGSIPLLAQGSLVIWLDGTKISPTQIDALVTHSMETAHVTGVGIAVLNGGKVVYLKTYGMGGTVMHLPLTPDSIMTAASLTKPVFATMVMQLVQQRIIDRDTPVYQYLPKPVARISTLQGPTAKPFSK